MSRYLLNTDRMRAQLPPEERADFDAWLAAVEDPAPPAPPTARGGDLVPLGDALGRVAERLQALAAGGDTAARARLERVERVRGQSARGLATRPARPACAACGDTHYVRLEVPRHDPRFGRALPCPACGMGHQRDVIERTWPVPPATLALATEPIIPHQPPLARLAQLVEALVARRPAGALILLDGGPSAGYGTAKTHALARLYAGLWEAGATALYVESARRLEETFTLFDDALAQAEAAADPEGRASASAERARRWEQLAGVEALLVDEANRHTRKDGNSWVERHFFTLIDERLARRRTTVLAGNDLASTLHPGILDRARAADAFTLSLDGVPSARAAFGRSAGTWHEGI